MDYRYKGKAPVKLYIPCLTMQLEENTIIRRLNEIPPNNIYYISPKQYFLRGYDYYKDRRVSEFIWSKDRLRLTAKVVGSSVYSVNFYAGTNKLNYECSCPAWSPSVHCKHVICALLTIKNTQNPDLFVIPGGYNRDSYRERLKKNLLLAADSYEPLETLEPIETGDTISPVYEIVFENDPLLYSLKVTVEKDGRPISGNKFFRLPEDILKIIAYDSYYYSSADKPIIAFLEKNDNTHPIFIRIDKKKVALKWDKTLVFNTKTEIDADDNIVSIRKLAVIDDFASSGYYMLGSKLIADVESGRLGVINNDDGWGIWNFYERFLDDHDYINLDYLNVSELFYYRRTNRGENYDIKMPLELFHSIQMIIPDESKGVLNNLILKNNQEASGITDTIPTYSMIIEPIDKYIDKMILKACCNVSGSRDATSVLFFGFFSYSKNKRRLSQSLRTRKRWSVLVKTFFKLLNIENKSEVQKLIRESLSEEGDFLKRIIRQEAKDLLVGVYNRLNTKSSSIRNFSGQWHMVRNNKIAESLLYSIPFTTFGVDIFHGMDSHNEMIVDAKKVYRMLPVLCQRLKENGIPLFLKGKTVVTSKWDFSFDASRDKGIDWFEIKPEITCDGELIGDAQWEKILSEDGVLENDDVIQVLDSNSQEILKTISTIYQDNKSTSKQEKDIVHVPRLKILDWIYLRNAGVKVILSEEDEELVERLNRFEKIEKRPLPDKLKAKLRHYQMDGYYWLAFLYEHKFGACLADDMGLGKTIQAITLLAGIKEGTVRYSESSNHLPHLIVLPPSLLFNWENEIKRFYPNFKVHFYTGKERSTDFKDCDIILTTYGLIRMDIETLKKESFNVIVFDEAQTVKNIYADTTGAVRQLNGLFKLTVTGTPLENHIGEYYSILDLAIPGLLGDYDTFKSYIKLDTSPYIDMLLRRTKPFVLRRTKEKILKELPPKIETDIYLELTDKQKALYKKTVESVRRAIANAYENKTASQAQIIAITAILKLRQICVSPRLIDTSFDDHSPKIEFLINKLKELLSEGHSALVFSQFTSFLDILEEDLKKHEITFLRLDGSTAIGKRKHLVEGFQNNDSPSIFLLSLKAGGQGLNLTRASYVFHLDPWWNPAVENQASDRAHRIGQKNRVTIMRILMRHTVEEKMMELKKKKLVLYNAVMGESVSGRKGLSVSKADFDYLLEGTI